MMACTKKRLYRSRNGKVFGICQGIADWKDLPVEYIRLFVILAFVFTGFFPVGVLYFLAAIILPKEPEGMNRNSSRYRSDSGRDRYGDAKRDFEDLKNRVRNMESRVFDKEKDWEDRFKKG